MITQRYSSLKGIGIFHYPFIGFPRFFIRLKFRCICNSAYYYMPWYQAPDEIGNYPPHFLIKERSLLMRYAFAL
ncbi:MAG TPA: hypothetical protein DIC22_02985 [Chitinophagaceae bacterium]|jgi:hypothetical protein|nr:hypothetical protein [Chitinophagaceae bacterium]